MNKMVSVPRITQSTELPSYLQGLLLVLSLLPLANAQPGRTPQATPTPEESAGNSQLAEMGKIGPWILGSVLLVLVCRCCYQYVNDKEFGPEPAPPAPPNEGNVANAHGSENV